MLALQVSFTVFYMGFLSNVFSEPNYLEFFPDTQSRINRRGIASDALPLPNGVWDAEKNYTLTHPDRRNTIERQIGNDLPPPSTACITLKVVYDRNWVQSSGGDGEAAARSVLAEAQNIYKTKFASNNQLGTSITINYEVIYDQSNTWQADGSSIEGAGLRSHIDTSSYSTQHYAFLGGKDNGGAIGVAYVGTPCLRLSQDQRYKVSITEWYNNIADTAGVFAHELGHALGMLHDFIDSDSSDRYDRNGVKCTDINGVMDYGSRSSVDKFSTCSKQDFRDYYNHVLGTYNEFCLSCDNTNPTNPPEPTENPPTEPTECDGTNFQSIRQCCRKNGPCNVGEGDCNRDSECASGLQCGNNNCKRDFSSTGTKWRRGHDCCFVPENPPPEPQACDGTDRGNIKRCCRNNGPCLEGEGDCNRDSECADGLRCGNNNCKRDFSSTGTKWKRGHDCCVADTTDPATTEEPNPTEGPNTTEGPNPPAGACGVKPAGIVGGSEVTPYSIPWQVAFVRRGEDDPFCGGTLISDRHVLTAAHCTSSSRSYDVIVGEHKITSDSDGTRHRVCRFVDHPNNRGVVNDFAILHLETPVQIGTRAAPACLPPTSFGGDFFDGKTLTVSGWGALSSGGGSPTVLHSVDVPGMTNAACRNSYSSISADMLCAGRTSGGIDSCQGDSGGPLTYTTGGRTYISGVVSWGRGCAWANYPGVYARVTEALDWIKSEMTNTCSSSG